ncbi:hypothetical protein [Candidatus Poriferisodalis sp.]|uniref:hypothetical protein n=1 Tax=Candidatus Poriferisodalis sp. TaxID=3101277 RepID=UPI003B515947
MAAASNAGAASTGESTRETRTVAIDAEVLAGKRFPYQEDMSLVEDIDLLALTPGPDINWLEDITLLAEDGVPAVFDRYSNSFLKIYFEIPVGREDEIARKVLMKHLIEGNSYGITLKDIHCKFPQVELGPWVEDSRIVGTDWRAPVLEGWSAPTAH